MSDTGERAARGSAAGRAGCGGCLLKGLLAAVVLVALLSGWAIHVRSQVRQDRPFDFPAFRFGPLERSLLTAKFEVLELPSLLTGGPTEVVLSQRELNGLLFGDANHQDAGPKARVLVEDGRLRVESSTSPQEGVWLNVSALVTVTLGPGIGKIELVEGKVGAYQIGSLVRGMVQAALDKGLADALQRDQRLARVQAFTVEGDHVRLVYKAR